MGKRKHLPAWAFHKAEAGDREQALTAYRKGTLWAHWDPHPVYGGLNFAGKKLRAGPSKDWARQKGWPTPFFSFKKVFLETLLANDENFRLALGKGGVELYFPKKEHVISANELKEFDERYYGVGEDGRRDWGGLVEDLREIRRAVEAGVTVYVEDQELDDWQSFYTWAHGRYHALEDGWDDWIGNDD